MGVRLSIVSATFRKSRDPFSYQFEQERIVIGRGSGADVRIPDRTVSDVHAVIQFQSDRYVITDTNSTNGTKVNGEKLIPECAKGLGDGDLIELGEYVMSVETRIIVADPTTSERTSELARRLMRERVEGEAMSLGYPQLVVVDGHQKGQRMEISNPPARFLVGRGDSCQMKLNDDEVSREHMEVISDLDGVLIRNLDSKNGVLLGRQRVTERRLRNGNELLLGKTQLRFEDPAEDSLRILANQSDLPLMDSDKKKEDEVQSTSEASPLKNSINKGKNASAKVRKRDRKAALSTAVDLAIYFLALLILILSLAGLVLLLRIK